MSFIPLRCSSTEEEHNLAYIAAERGLEKLGEPAGKEGAGVVLLVCGLFKPVGAAGLGWLGILEPIPAKGLTGVA